MATAARYLGAVVAVLGACALLTALYSRILDTRALFLGPVSSADAQHMEAMLDGLRGQLQRLEHASDATPLSALQEQLQSLEQSNAAALRRVQTAEKAYAAKVDALSRNLTASLASLEALQRALATQAATDRAAQTARAGDDAANASAALQLLRQEYLRADGEQHWDVVVELNEGFMDIFCNWLYFVQRLDMHARVVVYAHTPEVRRVLAHLEAPGVLEIRKAYMLDLRDLSQPDASTANMSSSGRGSGSGNSSSPSTNSSSSSKSSGAGQSAIAKPTSAKAAAPDLGAAAAFKSAPYLSMVSRRGAIMVDALRRGRHVLYSDIDTVWLQNPFLFQPAPDADVAFQLDKLGDARSVCTGFFFARNRAVTRMLFGTWDRLLRRENQLNQPLMKRLLGEFERAHELRAEPLDAVRFASGRTFFQLRLRNGTVVVHNNYAGTHEIKTRRMKEAGLWRPHAAPVLPFRDAQASPAAQLCMPAPQKQQQTPSPT